MCPLETQSYLGSRVHIVCTKKLLITSRIHVKVDNNIVTHLSHGDIKGGLSLTQATGDVDTVDVGVVTLAEHHPVERSVKLDPHSEQILLTLNLQILDLSHVGRLTVRPGISC